MYAKSNHQKNTHIASQRIKQFPFSKIGTSTEREREREWKYFTLEWHCRSASTTQIFYTYTFYKYACDGGGGIAGKQ